MNSFIQLTSKRIVMNRKSSERKMLSGHGCTGHETRMAVMVSEGCCCCGRKWRPCSRIEEIVVEHRTRSSDRTRGWSWRSGSLRQKRQHSDDDSLSQTLTNSRRFSRVLDCLDEPWRRRLWMIRCIDRYDTIDKLFCAARLKPFDGVLLESDDRHRASQVNCYRKWHQPTVVGMIPRRRLSVHNSRPGGEFFKLNVFSWAVPSKPLVVRSFRLSLCWPKTHEIRRLTTNSPQSTDTSAGVELETRRDACCCHWTACHFTRYVKVERTTNQNASWAELARPISGKSLWSIWAVLCARCAKQHVFTYSMRGLFDELMNRVRVHGAYRTTAL